MRRDLLESMRRHPLICFFLLAFALSWAYWLLIWAPLHLPHFLFPVVAYIGPTVSAFLMTAIISGRPGVLLLGFADFFHHKLFQA